jgi:hypothetical protein
VLCIASWLAAFGIVAHIDSARRPTALEGILAPFRSVLGPVIVIGVPDIRSVLGPRLDANIQSIQAGRGARSNPYTDQDALTAAIQTSLARVMVLPTRLDTTGLPSGWRPPADWRKAGDDGKAAVWVLD